MFSKSLFPDVCCCFCIKFHCHYKFNFFADGLKALYNGILAVKLSEWLNLWPVLLEKCCFNLSEKKNVSLKMILQKVLSSSVWKTNTAQKIIKTRQTWGFFFLWAGITFKRIAKKRLVKSFNRSSHRRCSTKKGVLKNFTKFTGKYLSNSLFFNKIAGVSLKLH